MGEQADRLLVVYGVLIGALTVFCVIAAVMTR